MVVVLMGVSGCGKTSVAKELADRHKMTYVEGDEFHPDDNVQKMSSGIPLTEEDRIPWLQRLRRRVDEAIKQGESLVLTCSALSIQSRKILGTERPEIELVFLEGSMDLIASRLRQREGHYMPAELLDSQFAALQRPSKQEAHAISIENDLETIADEIDKIVFGSKHQD